MHKLHKPYEEARGEASTRQRALKHVLSLGNRDREVAGLDYTAETEALNHAVSKPAEG